MSLYRNPHLTPAQADQLHVLVAMGATNSDRAVDRRSCDPDGRGRLNALINGGIISAVLVPRGYAMSRKVKASHGEPARTLYWATAEGVALKEAISAGGPA